MGIERGKMSDIYSETREIGVCLDVGFIVTLGTIFLGGGFSNYYTLANCYGQMKYTLWLWQVN